MRATVALGACAVVAGWLVVHHGAAGGAAQAGGPGDEKHDKWRMEGPITSKSMFCPAGRFVSGTRGDENWDMHWELSEDYGLITEITRRRGAVVTRDFRRLTLDKDVLVRERCTVETRDADGTRRLGTRICGHHDAPHCAGEYKFFVDTQGVERWLAAKGGKGGVDPEDPGEACPLDDRREASDAELEEFACKRWMSYDQKARVTFLVADSGVSLHSSYLWPGKAADAAKFTYAENPAFPKRYPRAQDAQLRRRNTWHTRVYAQAVDREGKMRTDLPRVAWFIYLHKDGVHTFTRRVFVVVQEMDYASGPRPKIRSRSVSHHLYHPSRVPSERGIWDLGPEKCKEYEVEVEDVQDGEAAMRGEWIRSVRPRGEAFLKVVESEGFEALLSEGDGNPATNPESRK